MAIATNWFTMDNKAGVDLNNPFTSVDSTTNPNPLVPAAPHNLGDRVQGNNGSEWLFARASATVSAFNVVAVNRNFRFINMTTALMASNLYHPAIAEFQPLGGVTTGNANGGVINTDDFLWLMTKCAMNARVNTTVSATVALGAALYISGSVPGFVTASAGTSALPGGGRLNGMMFTGAVSLDAASATAVVAMEIGMFSYILPGVLVSAGAISA
jgi:hypothetical protein